MEETTTNTIGQKVLDISATQDITATLQFLRVFLIFLLPWIERGEEGEKMRDPRNEVGSTYLRKFAFPSLKRAFWFF